MKEQKAHLTLTFAKAIAASMSYQTSNLWKPEQIDQAVKIAFDYAEAMADEFINRQRAARSTGE